MKKSTTKYQCRRTVRITRMEDEKLCEFAVKVGIPVSEYMRLFSEADQLLRKPMTK